MKAKILNLKSNSFQQGFIVPVKIKDLMVVVVAVVDPVFLLR